MVYHLKYDSNRHNMVYHFENIGANSVLGLGNVDYILGELNEAQRSHGKAPEHFLLALLHAIQLLRTC